MLKLYLKTEYYISENKFYNYYYYIYDLFNFFYPFYFKLVELKPIKHNYY